MIELENTIIIICTCIVLPAINVYKNFIYLCIFMNSVVIVVLSQTSLIIC